MSKALAPLTVTIAALVLFSLSTLQAQDQHTTARAPVPSQIVSAKKIFISNGGQEGVPRFGTFSGEPERTYNQFYAAMKDWGRYELVSAPSDADLILEVSFSVPAAGCNVFKGDTLNGPYVPRFRLLVLDPKTHFTLWAFIENVDWAVLAGNRNKNFDQGMTNLMNDFEKLAGQPVVATDSSQK
jgi:hypothetical protein